MGGLFYFCVNVRVIGAMFIVQVLVDYRVAYQDVSRL